MQETVSMVSDRNWFLNGFTLALDGQIPHRLSPEMMWRGWGFGVLERDHHFERCRKRGFRGLWRKAIAKIRPLK